MRQELHGLLSGLCDDALTPAERARLEQLLEADAECRAHYLQYVDMHARLLAHPQGTSTVSAAEAFATPNGAPVLTGPQPAGESTPAGTTRRRRLLPGYLLVACATLAASLLVQVLWWHPREAQQQRSPSSSEARNAEHVATLMQAVDCVWEGPSESLRIGSRFLPGELRLQKGLARIRFDTGTDLIVEAPAELTLESVNAARLHRGKVVFRTEAPAAPIDLHTPSATLLDFGTEYAVRVGADGEEIHVFDGEVQRVPRTAAGEAEPEYLKAGEARRYEKVAGFHGAPTEFDPMSFVRRLPNANPPAADLAAGLLAYEGFDYQDANALQNGQARGGFGWIGSWTAGLVRPIGKQDPKPPTLNLQEGLTRPGTVPSIGGCFEYTGFAVHHRRLATPVRLNADGVYYLSFLFRRQGPAQPGYGPSSLSIMLRTDEEYHHRLDPRKWLNIGVGASNQLYAQLGRSCSRACLPLLRGTNYLVVAKIVAGSTTADQVFLRVYRPGETVGMDETGSWTIVSPPFESHLVFDHLAIQVNGNLRQMIDEIRLGTTWSSVTAAWAAVPAENRNNQR
jgi:ferric-dicitrate binding protein FerR (iron transport regulator)